MKKVTIEDVKKFQDIMGDINSEDFMKRVEEVIEDDAIESIADFLSDFYGIDDDDELGHLAQIMITGILLKTNC